MAKNYSEVMKDIGSIFPLSEREVQLITKDYPFFDGNLYRFSLCREALFVVAQKEKKDGCKVLIPSYTCDTVITPFLESEWNCVFYPINKDLSINEERTKQIIDSDTFNLFVVHPYFGMEFSQQELGLISYAKKKGCKIVIDLTQCIFSSQCVDEADYYVGSYRKWYQVPDGGFLWAKNSIGIETPLINEYFVSLQTDSMFLRGEYFRNNDEHIKQISIRLNKLAVESVDFNIKPHKMADISVRLMNEIDMNHVQTQRFSNYKYLLQNIKASSIDLLCNDMNKVSTAPLYFIIYTKNRKEVQARLCREHIYAPIIWPVYYNEVLIDDITKQIYDETLAIPIDQRYNEMDMVRVVNILNQF